MSGWCSPTTPTSGATSPMSCESGGVNEVNTDARTLTSVAERLDALADTADLMGDERNAERFRSVAADCRSRAMDLLDEGAQHGP